MAMAYDRATGTSHRVGTRADVEAWAEAARSRLEEDGLARLAADLALVAFLATPEALSAVAECWQRSGSALAFAEAFGQREGAAPSLRH
jgi:hypothetical protein